MDWPIRHVSTVDALRRRLNALNEAGLIGGGLASTDELPEGTTNLYFTNPRAVSAIKADPDWKAGNWDTAYAYSQIGHLESAGGTANQLQINDGSGGLAAASATWASNQLRVPTNIGTHIGIGNSGTYGSFDFVTRSSQATWYFDRDVVGFLEFRRHNSAGSFANSGTIDFQTDTLDFVNIRESGNALARQAINLTAGNGLTGGGDLSANRTFTLGSPLTVTGSSTNTVNASSHSHALTVNLGDVGLTTQTVLAGTNDNAPPPNGNSIDYRHLERIKVHRNDNTYVTPTDWTRSAVWKFTQQSQLDSPPGTGSWAHLLTVQGWAQHNSAYPSYQMVFRNGAIGVRQSVNNTTWADWRTLDEIVEEGSNANGEYIKYQSGLMIAWHEHPSEAVSVKQVEGVSGEVWRAPWNTWFYPVEFIAPPVISFGDSKDMPTTGWATHGFTNAAADRVSIALSSFIESTSSHILSVVARGRWK